MTTTKTANLNTNNGISFPYVKQPLRAREYYCPVCNQYRIFSEKGDNYFCTYCKVVLAELPSVTRG